MPTSENSPNIPRTYIQDAETAELCARADEQMRTPKAMRILAALSSPRNLLTRRVGRTVFTAQNIGKNQAVWSFHTEGMTPVRSVANVETVARRVLGSPTADWTVARV